LNKPRELQEHQRLTVALVIAGFLHALLFSLETPSTHEAIAPQSDLKAYWWPSSAPLGSGTNQSITAEQQYIERWRARMERYANRHFPPRTSRKRSSQAPVLEVVIRSNGALGELRLRRSSGDSRLDSAVMDLVREAAPFEGFTTALAARRQSLRFAYEWRFEAGEPKR